MPSSILLQQLPLCKYCRAREGFKVATRNSPMSSCYLCDGALAGLISISNEIVERLREYEFDTFLIGASIPQAILDREDELRSRFKIKGIEGIKSQITRLLSKKIAATVKRRVDYSRPDLTILVSLTDKTISINPRALWLSASYLKLVRGIPQRSSVCNICNGLGCAQCNYMGKSTNSVQAIISAFLVKEFEAESCNFVWLGSEDENSLVGGSGRPFYAEVLKPKRRKKIHGDAGEKPTRKRRNFSFRSKEIQISRIEILDRKITSVPQFEVVASINLLKKPGTSGLDIAHIEELESKFSNLRATIRLSRKFRNVQKRIESIKTEIFENGDVVRLLVKCDGGIPLRKLVNGRDNGVEPNLAEFFSSYEIDPLRPFDIIDVKIKRTNEKLTLGTPSGGHDSELPVSEEIQL